LPVTTGKAATLGGNAPTLFCLAIFVARLLA
jgi:hypothetical protein